MKRFSASVFALILSVSLLTMLINTAAGGQDSRQPAIAEPYPMVSTPDAAESTSDSSCWLDPSFDGDGKLTTDFGSGSDYGHAMAIQEDGKIVVAGYANIGGNDDFALARYHPDGSLDVSFDGDGKVTTDFGSLDYGHAVAIQGDGKIVVAGQASNGIDLDFALARYHPDGSLDTSFDGDGKVTTDFGSSDYGYAMAIQGDGKIVVAGSAHNGSNYDFALARYRTDLPVLYVDAAASGAGDGSSWDDAFTDLQSALTAANRCDQIWVAQGIYRPDEDLPGSCQEIRVMNPAAADGEYLINANGRIFSVYCHDMAGAPGEYLTLVYTGTNENFSQYTAGGSSPGSDVRTRYHKVRLDPLALRVDISDQTFASSQGQLDHSGSGPTVTSMPYGIAMDCAASGSSTGLSNIDLRGTPFVVSDTFTTSGYLPGGSATLSANDQVMDLTGGGLCGWNAPHPPPDPPFNQIQSSYTLDLAHIGTDRHASFYLPSGVAIYGGFAGDETSRDQRDWEANLTVLSGDIDHNDQTNAQGVITDTANIQGGNAYHVVSGGGVTETAVLDGFTITGGYADGIDPHDRGGGMLVDNGSPTLANLIFSGNMANHGGGMFNQNGSNPRLTDVTFTANAADWGGGLYCFTNSNATVVNVTFTGNTASQGGGGMVNHGSSPTLANVLFSGNATLQDGGGLANWNGSSPALVNVTFSGNAAAGNGGGMYLDNSSATIFNSIFWNNEDNTGTGTPSASFFLYYSFVTWSGSLIQGRSTPIDSDPFFVRNPDSGDGDWTTLGDNDYGDLQLQAGSPAIDQGNNADLPADAWDLDGDGDTSEPIPYDLLGHSRVVNGTVDMGACEHLFAVYLPAVVR